MIMKLISLLQTVVTAATLLVPLAQAAPVVGVLEREAPKVAAPQSRVMLGLAAAGTRIVGVGERGLIVLSDDNGKTWRQATVPVSITLTAAAFPTPKIGWAIGHAGVVLRSGDGGETWEKQLDGIKVIQLLKEAAHAGAAGMDVVAQQFAGDGPDKPFLDLHFVDEHRGIIVGAYGLVLHTEDGGKTWRSAMEHADNPNELHIYALGVQGKTVWLAGEQGYIARSGDGGKTFARVQAPYRGSYFDLAVLPEGEVIVGGLKGNAFRLSAQGTQAQKIEGFSPVSLAAASVLKDSRIVFANQAGQIFVSKDGQSVQPVALDRPAAPVNALLQTADGSILAAGVRGIVSVGAVPGASK